MPIVNDGMVEASDAESPSDQVNGLKAMTIRIDELTYKVTSVVDTCAEAADRLFGTRPAVPEVTDEKENPESPRGEFEEMEQSIDRLDRAIRRMQSQANRIVAI